MIGKPYPHFLAPARGCYDRGQRAATAAAQSEWREHTLRAREEVAEWAEIEFGAAELGDSRRPARLVELATVLGDQPSASLPAACADPATLTAAYRCFDNDEIAPDAVLTSHIQATYARLRAVPQVLAVHDTTDLDWTHHPATTGLGPLATAHQQGVLLHSTLTFTPDRVPLGLLAQQVWARDPATYGQLPDQHDRPISAKESAKGLHSLAAATAAAAACPTTHFIHVADAAADVYDLLAAERAANVDLLVRAGQDRRVEHEAAYLWAAMGQAPIATWLEVDLPRQGDRPARRARVAVRCQALTVRPPRRRAREGLAAVPLWAVWVVEEQAPVGTEPIEWLLLTTCPVRTAADAEERVAWYACRWGIEVWHKVVKSGCRIEARQLATAARLERCLAVYRVIAWRVLQAAMLARAGPNLPCTALLEADEWPALGCTIHRQPTPPTAPPTLQEAVGWIARLGGHLGRTRAGDPGVTVLGRGFQHLTDLTTMYRIMKPTLDKEEVGKGWRPEERDDSPC